MKVYQGSPCPGPEGVLAGGPLQDLLFLWKSLHPLNLSGSEGCPCCLPKFLALCSEEGGLGMPFSSWEEAGSSTFSHIQELVTL